MEKRCPQCGCKNPLPPNLNDPKPCRNCGCQVFPDLDPEKRVEYSDIFSYGGEKDEIDEREGWFAMGDVRIKILDFLSKAPDVYWRARTIKRWTMKASRFKRVDAFDFGRCLRELREEGLVEKNGSRLQGWRIMEKGLEMLREID